MNSRIFFLILFLLPFVSSENISLNYPEKIIVNEENNFQIKILDLPSGIYDVKIEIFCNDKRVSKIFNNNTWKSTIYYVNDVLENENEFLIKASEICNANIIVKLRDEKEKIFTFSDYKIEIIEKPKENLQKEEKTEETKTIDEKKAVNFSKENSKIQEKILENEPVNIINLTPKTIKTNENFLSDKGYVKYALFGFCILLITLFLLKPKRKQNEFN